MSDWEWSERWYQTRIEELESENNRLKSELLVFTSRSKEIKDGSGFRHYDTSKGHCGLCGRIECNGGCFR